MKTLQLMGNLIPILLVFFGYFLFGDTEPNTPNYAGAAMAMVWIGVSIFAVGFVLIFILPSSLILLTTENRKYFSFNSKAWLSVLFINWLFIGLYCLCILVFALTSVR
ncbi:hypothetical protein [Arsukibacterium sp.]|uniref:hypothetical protein n=1 Tax=Arsukibacterium sp. TaxID=1977258 RepID=UPI00299E813C|nr:hypothetical protein [Arsukibacterium sp.]MDX1678279.1 hypothetical protein [Arsukibacterium sp.]